jgi:hypothetical protein
MTILDRLKVTLFKQNKHHKHGVFLHTLKVIYHCYKAGRYDLLVPALLHDIGKPIVAYQKPEDIEANEYSFTDHEEKSYQIIKNWRFLSEKTKLIVRYHYLIRDIKKSKEKGDVKRYLEKKRIWDELDNKMKEDLKVFLKCDDNGKK